MDILFLLIPLSLALVFLIGGVLWFAVRSGQFDDLDRPDLQLLADDDLAAAHASGEAEKPPHAAPLGSIQDIV